MHKIGKLDVKISIIPNELEKYMPFKIWYLLKACKL